MYDLRNEYIENPKRNGYRGIHIVGARVAGKFPEYTGFHVELQLRTGLMHAWATAVEIVDTFAGTSIKTSDPTEIETTWDHYFALTSAAMAVTEGSPVPPGTPRVAGEIRQELRTIGAETLTPRIASWSQTIRETSTIASRGSYFLLQLDIGQQNIVVTQFSNPTQADIAYREAELRDTSESDSVLVAGRSITDVRHAYPNYFADTTRFTDFVSDFLTN